MQEKLTIARPYARAVFEYAQAEGAMPAWSGLLDLLGKVTADPAMRQVIGDPRVEKTRLEQLLFELCAPVLFDSGRNFIKVLVESERLDVAPEIKALFEQLRADAGGMAKIEVVSAFPMDNDQLKIISESVTKRLGKAVELTAREDKSLIGGVVVHIGDAVIDGSVRGRLQQLANEMA